MEEPKIERIRGSEGRLDYVIIARKEDSVLAVKAFVMPTPQGIGFMLRLRACLDPSAAKSDTAPNWTKLWPNIQFDKVDPERASAVTGFMLQANVPPPLLAQVVVSQGLAFRLIPVIKDVLGDVEPVIPDFTLRDMLQGEFISQIEGTLKEAGMKSAGVAAPSVLQVEQALTALDALEGDLGKATDLLPGWLIGAGEPPSVPEPEPKAGDDPVALSDLAGIPPPASPWAPLGWIVIGVLIGKMMWG